MEAIRWSRSCATPACRPWWPTGPSVETLADGFQFTEGPLWCPDGSLLFQDIKAEPTYRLRPGRPPEIVRTGTGAANGQTFTADGRIVFCEQNGRRVSRMNPDGSGVETVAETWSGKRLNSPNDVVCRSDGLRLLHRPPLRRRPGRPGLALPGGLRPRPRPRPTAPGSWPTTSRSPTAWRSRPTSGRSTSATPPATTSGRSRSSRRAR